MNKFCFLFLFLPIISFGQTTDTSGIQWKELEWDFGKVKFDNPVNHIFKFVNKSDKVAIIISGESSCGCTHPVWKTGDILPGDSAFVSATYNSKTEGVFNKQIIIYTTRSPFATKLWLKGEVVR